MEIWSLGLTVLFAAIAAVWKYGSSEETERARFKNWVGTKLSVAAPHARWIFTKGLFLTLAVLCGAVLVGVWVWISSFLGSQQPMQRKEVFSLGIQLINGVLYGSAFVAFLILTIRKLDPPEKHQENLMLLEQGDQLVLSIADGADLQAVARQLAESGITITFKKLESGKASVAAETPPLVVKRVEKPS